MENKPQNSNQNAETVSTAIMQKFEDDGGLPLDHPIVQERERLRRGPPSQQQSPGSDEKQK